MKKLIFILIFVFILIITLIIITFQCKELICVTNEEYQDYNHLRIQYNGLVDDYNELINESLEKEEQMMLCQKEEISVPKKTLIKKTFCKVGCDYNLLCSGSMKPYFSCNNKLEFYFNIEKEEIEVCDIIAFESPEYPSLDSKPFYTIHRIIGINESGYITKGDGTIHPDKHIIQFEDIKGKLIGISYYQ